MAQYPSLYSRSFQYWSIRHFPRQLRELYPPVLGNVSQEQIGGRLNPRALLEQNMSILIQAQHEIVNAGAVMSGVAVNVSVPDPDINAVNPACRIAIYDNVVGT